MFLATSAVVNTAPNISASRCGFSSIIDSAFGAAGMYVSSGMDALVVWQSTSGTVFRDPTSGCFFVQKVELQKADMDGAPLSLVYGSGKVPTTDLALPMKECTAVDRALLLGPLMSGREMIPRHSQLAFWSASRTAFRNARTFS